MLQKYLCVAGSMGTHVEHIVFIANCDYLLCFAFNKRRFVAYVIFCNKGILRNIATIF
jgi:hypothetical protein